MRIAAPHELLVDKAKRIAVVGNSSSVLQWKAGSKIDSFDVVIRFNEARTSGYEESVGRRTDILFANLSNSADKSPPPATTLQPRYVVCLLTQRDRHTDASRFAQWARGCSVIYSWVPDIVPDPKAVRARALTTGLYALYLVREWLQPQNLFVTGFSAFGIGKGNSGHYWTQETPPAIFFHELDREAHYLSYILKGFRGRLEVTPEVDALLGRDDSRNAALRSSGFTKKISGRIARSLLEWGTRWRRYSETI